MNETERKEAADLLRRRVAELQAEGEDAEPLRDVIARLETGRPPAWVEEMDRQIAALAADLAAPGLAPAFRAARAGLLRQMIELRERIAAEE